MIEIDGNMGEGGGQILRTALGLSVLTKKPFEMKNIRAGREKPGLKNQHLHAIKALIDICDARVEGAEIGSQDVQFFPGKISKSKTEIDVGTAGSITLILQSLLIPCIFSEKKIQILLKGGTDTKWAMPIDYFRNVFLPQMRRFADIDLKMEKRGYLPIGAGRVDITIKPRYLFDKERNVLIEKELNKKIEIEDNESIESAKDRNNMQDLRINLCEQGKLLYIRGVSHASNELSPAQVSERTGKAANFILSRSNCPVEITSEYTSTACIGSGITLYALFSHEKKDTDRLNPIILGADALGEKRIAAEQVGETCAKKLLEEIGSCACVDSHLADNMIPYLALVGGKIKTSKITEHTRTNIKITEMFLPVKFTIDEKNNIISTERIDSKERN